jgi:hypothetical protein
MTFISRNPMQTMVSASLLNENEFSQKFLMQKTEAKMTAPNVRSAKNDTHFVSKRQQII